MSNKLNKEEIGRIKYRYLPHSNMEAKDVRDLILHIEALEEELVGNAPGMMWQLKLRDDEISRLNKALKEILEYNPPILGGRELKMINQLDVIYSKATEALK